MRAFIALLAYTALHGEGPPPVLLIDEAETHLHYAAQADLVQVMTEQTAAAQIIYTTHSAVFAEGPTELVLLPALLREATQQRTLGFQVAPGLALVNRRTASSLELEAARVA